MNHLIYIGHMATEPHPVPDHTLAQALAKHEETHGVPADVAFVNEQDFAELGVVDGVHVVPRWYVPRAVAYCGVQGSARR